MDTGSVEPETPESGADTSLEKRLVETCRTRPDAAGSDPGPDVRTDQIVTTAAAAHPDQEWFRLTFDHAPIGMVVVDGEGRLERANDAFCALVGRPLDQLAGTCFDEIADPGDGRRHALLRRCLGGDGPPTGRADLRVIGADGHVAATVVTWCQLSPARVLGQVLDMTEARRAQATSATAEELRQRYDKELARANADLARFATVAAHDLKSPLQVISGFGALLEQTQGHLLDERGHDFLASILKGATRMNLLIDDLLAYAHVGAELRPPEAVPLEAVLAEVTAALGPQMAATGATVTIEGLPVVVGDPGQFRDLLEHLVANGVRFVAQGTAPRIRVSASRMVNAWCIDVADNGIGVDVQYRSHIFGIFKRLGHDHHEGTGIGLAICKRIVEQRGGSIWVEDSPGGGSRFRFTVPDEIGPPWPGVGRGDDAGAGADPDSSLGSGANDCPGGYLPHPGPAPSLGAEQVPGPACEVALDVLLVEDDDDHARLVEETLATGGAYRLRRARDLAGARTELRLHHTDCVLLDLFLPDGQGLESLAQLTTLEPLVPIVILTSLAYERLGFQAVHEGAQDYLVKGGFDRPLLSRSLRHAIERKALEARFAEQALHDPLTGLANRTLLFDRLRSEFARAGRSGTSVAVFYLDVDGFKAINDRLGHEAGDEVLVRVARRLGRVVRPGDTVGRIGGDEFVVVCGGLDTTADVDQMQARIAEAVGRPLVLSGGTELVTASVGVAVGRETAEEPEAVIGRADEAMYHAKRRRALERAPGGERPQ